VDAERWLPLKERSYYVAPLKAKSKKGVKPKSTGGHQGGAAGDADSALDMSAKKPEVKAAPPRRRGPK
jgi:hypothetical protein